MRPPSLCVSRFYKKKRGHATRVNQRTTDYNTRVLRENIYISSQLSLILIKTDRSTVDNQVCCGVMFVSVSEKLKNKSPRTVYYR